MEIEIKARLKEPESVMQRLSNLGCELSDSTIQDDLVFAAKADSMESFLANPVFVRIRVENGTRVILTAKKSKEQSGEKSLIKHEHEMVIDSVLEARGFLEMLGLREVVRTIKKRRTTSYAGYEICFDEIDGVGSFIELEKMGEESEAEHIQEEMKAFLATLGVHNDDLVHKGYDILMLEEIGFGVR